MRFSIRFTVDELALGPVLAALNSHDGVVFNHLAIEPLTPPRPAPQLGRVKSPAKPYKPRPGASKAQTAREIVLDLLEKDGPQPYARIKDVLVTRGFAAGGVGSLINHRMCRQYGEI